MSLHLGPVAKYIGKPDPDRLRFPARRCLL